MKPLFLIYLLNIFLFHIVYGQDENDSIEVYVYDASSQAYLNELRLTSLSKDTAHLHELIGENAFGWSCYGGEYPSRNFNSEWLIFKNHFNLMKNPESSPFWDLFLAISEKGFYFDGVNYTLPAFHFWGMAYTYDFPKIGSEYYVYVFISETVTIFSTPDLANGIKTIIHPVAPNQGYPYRFSLPKDGFQECYFNNELIGYVRKEDVIYWNFHFSFVKENGKWGLYFYEVC